MARRSEMKLATLAIAAVVALASVPAMAASHHHHRAHTRLHIYPNAGAYNYYNNNYYGRPGDPSGVYDGPHFIGRDPDPNVRQQLYREYYWFGPGSPI
jgi:hypothetical protein